MKNILGISIYPDKATLKEIKDYVELASSYDFGLVFINLIGVLETGDKKIINHFKESIKICKDSNMQVTVDINRGTFNAIKFDYLNPDLKFFKDLNIDVLRLDESIYNWLPGVLSFNKYNIIIETNATSYNPTAFSGKIKAENMRSLHNFYPQDLTGLSYSVFKKANDGLRKSGIKVGAFITITDHESVGPWNISENLPTLEIHRHMPIGIQLNHILFNKLADYVYISTQFANKSDFEQIKESYKEKRMIKFNLEKNLSKAEMDIINYDNHSIRGDYSDELKRSTYTRVLFKDVPIPFRKSKDNVIKKGTLLVCNDNYLHYKGELQIATKDFISNDKRNVVGFIDKKFEFILDELDTCGKFEIIYK